jgi:hypothetical protein
VRTFGRGKLPLLLDHNDSVRGVGLEDIDPAASIVMSCRRAPLSPAAAVFTPGRVAHAAGDQCSSNILGITPTVAKVSSRIAEWCVELQNDIDADFLLQGIEHGFHITDSVDSPPHMSRSNYKSTSGVNKMKVEARILEEIEKGNYLPCSVKPKVVSALGAVPKGKSDIRVIHDLSRPNGGVNLYAHNTSVSYASIVTVTNYFSPAGFMAKIDLQAAYRSIPISPSDYELTGIRWKFHGNSEVSYLVDSRLPFGASMSCQIFQRISDAISRMMARRNLAVVCYLDDMICVAETELECLSVFNTLIELLERLGLDINWGKVALPTQKIVFLGVHIDSITRQLALPEKKFIELKSLVKTWSAKKRCTKLELQKFLGKLT